MAADTIPILLDLEVPLSLVESLVKHHVLATLTLHGNDHAAPNGHQQPEKEAPAPVLPSSAGAP